MDINTYIIQEAHGAHCLPEKNIFYQKTIVSKGMIIQNNFLMLLLYFWSSAFIIKCEKFAYRQTDNRQQVIRTCLKGIWNIEFQKNFSLSSKFQKEKNLKRKKEITKNMWMVCVFLPNFLTFGFRSPFTFQFLTLELLMNTFLFKNIYHYVYIIMYARKNSEIKFRHFIRVGILSVLKSHDH